MVSPPGSSDGADLAQTKFRRNYQACLPCRQRKVKCDLGNVDSPHEPPCARCKREGKHCHFSATRRRRRNSDGEELVDMDENDDYVIRNARKRVKPNHTEDVRDSTTSTRPYPVQPARMQSNSSLPPSERGSSMMQNLGDLRRSPEPELDPGPEDERATEAVMAALQTNEVFGGYDALNLLYEASQRSEGKQGGSHAGRRQSSHSSAVNSLPSLMPREVEAYFTTKSPMPPPVAQSPIATKEEEFRQALQAWSRFRFVRIGWITAREGIAYVQYFYDHMSPLSPLTMPKYREPATHARLLNNEPVLAITILTIASRYMQLDGIGSRSRGQAIHIKLWEYLESMIKRLIMGQEQFGGGFIGAGVQGASDVSPLKRKGLRTLSTILSLMLLTEWHPRALHFPSGNDDDELMTPEPLAQPRSSLNLAQTSASDAETGGRRVDSWLEPCWRSDRMCWMLLSVATSLAIEIGVFDESSWHTLAKTNPDISRTEIIQHATYRRHLKELLLVYVSQTAGRLSLTSILPANYLEATFEAGPDQRLMDRIIQMYSSYDINAVSSVLKETFMQQNPTEMVLHHFTELAAIMHAGNKKAFPNREATWDNILRGAYRTHLADFEPLLIAWRKEFDSCTTIPETMRLILELEYGYTKVYLNSLALHAVVKRCTNRHLEQNGSFPATNDDDVATIPPELLQAWIKDDRPYIDQLISGCRKVLNIVVDYLSPKGLLKFLPVRSYFRIISVTIILIKALALGATREEFNLAMSLIKNASSAMRRDVVDDVHIVNNFCDLSDNLMLRLRRRLLGAQQSRPAADGRAAPSLERVEQMTSSIRTMSTGAVPQQQDAPLRNTQPETLPTAPTVPATPPALPSVNSLLYQEYSGIPYNNPSAMTNSDSNNNLNNNQSSNDSHFPQLPGADWLTLDFDLLPQDGQAGASISQTMYGPLVNGHDLMDFLLPEQRAGLVGLEDGVDGGGAMAGEMGVGWDAAGY